MTKEKVLSIRVEEDLWRWLGEQSKRRGMKISRIVREVLEKEKNKEKS